VTVNGAGRDRDLSASDLVKRALFGRGGGNAELAQGGGLPASDAPALLASVEKAVAAHGA
jgi:alanyl-tRNA synthetase